MDFPEDKAEGCGISYLWMTGPNDPFIPACNWHDKAYAPESQLKKIGVSQEFVDKHFLELMLRIAGDDVMLKARAHLFYAIASTVGTWFWKDDVQSIPEEKKQEVKKLELAIANIDDYREPTMYASITSVSLAA